MLSHELVRKFQTFLKYPNRSLEDFESLLGMQKRNILIDIDKINDSLVAKKFPPITFKEGKLRPLTISEDELLQASLPHLKDYYFQDERPDLIILYVLLSSDYVSISHLEIFLHISRNSVLSDLKEVRARLLSFRVELLYTRQKGYFLAGEALALRRLLERTVNQILAFASGKWLLTYILKELAYDDTSQKITSVLETLAAQYRLSFISEKSRELSYLLTFLNTAPFSTSERVQQTYNELGDYYPFASLLEQFYYYYPNLKRENTFIITRLIGCIQGDLHHFYQEEVYLIMEDIINSVLVNTGLTLKDSPDLRENLYSHLLPAYYRIRYDVEMVNPLKEQIKEDYTSLFYLVKRSLLPLERRLEKTISDDEVAYFTIHFGSKLERPAKSEKNQLVALSVCPNGVSSSLILQSELKGLFPQIQFIEIHQLGDLAFLDASTYDLIFSTVAFQSAKPVYITQPLMGAVEKMLLKKTVCEEFNLPISNPVTVNELLDIISKHATITDKEGLTRDLSQYIIGNHLKKELGGKGLLDLLKEEFIQQCQEVATWQEAIRLAAQPLLKENIIEERYIDGMIASVNELGAYIVLAPKVAVPHAAPDKGAKALGISLLKLATPVSFDIEKEGDKERDVQLIFVLAAIDSSSHLKALQELSLILDDDENIEDIIAAKDKKEMLNIMATIIDEGDL
ncbi:PTS system mannitol (cryptic)-specific transporter subunit IIA [Streptococcus pseudoporcinus]|uniref:Ascorbate-specific PTS system EIIA component n=1 Tax=Streptococcus pseudoporcinus TaxID=361101 RepID=A0A4U9ZEI0_9STRE|nr:BglG family transcription antiterminator [Streptococcus pseudoporcinus]VTS39070.1 PTS system mannitol (cryptic)-specific transporter subunit IIA [Streptococcus pseudoporcinus]